MFASQQATGHSGQLAKDPQNVPGNEHIALIEASGSCSEAELRARLGAWNIAWCNSVAEGKYLVRFLVRDELLAAVLALNGTNWLGEAFSIVPYTVGQGQLLSSCVQNDSSTPRADSIPAVQLPDQLDYFSSMLQEELEQHLHQSSAQGPSTSAFQVHAMQELEPCNPEWNPPLRADDNSTLFAPLEDEAPFSADDSLLQSFSSGLSTCQLWSQRSIGAVARKDLAKFAAMQHMVQQHSSNSPTHASLLSAGHMMGIGSPWGSLHSAGSSNSLAAVAPPAALFQEEVRQSSSPSGLLPSHHSLGTPTAVTPRSPSGFDCGTALSMACDAATAAALLQQQVPGRSGSSSSARSAGWVGQPRNLSLNLPSELGLGDSLALNSSSAVADEEVMQLHGLAAARQQQQQQQQGLRAGSHQGYAGLLGGYGGDNSPLAGSAQYSADYLPGGAFGGRFMGPSGLDGAEAGSADAAGFAATAGHHSAAPPPPPPPQQQPGTPPAGLLGQQPPPPPPPAGGRAQQQGCLEGYGSGSYDGAPRGAGSLSPVPPAPPPRSITPGGTGSGGSGVWHGSTCGSGSPRVGGIPQPQSPSSGYRTSSRGPPGRGAFQHGMSNLGLGVGSQQQQQHGGYSNDSYISQQQQQQPPYRGPSPLPRGGGSMSPTPCVPPPPPPMIQPPPGYVAAATAAAAACGYNSSSLSPVPSSAPGNFGMQQRPGSACPGPISTMSSVPALAPCPPSSGASTPTARAALQATSSLQPPGLQLQASAPAAAAGANPLGATQVKNTSYGVSSNITNNNSGSSSTPDSSTTGGGSSNGNGGNKEQRQSGGGSASAPAKAAAGSTGSMSSSQEVTRQPQQLRADGALFIQELLQLLKQPGATAGNQFLANLRDMLDCALATAASSGAGSSSGLPALTCRTSTDGHRPAGSNKNAAEGNKSNGSSNGSVPRAGKQSGSRASSGGAGHDGGAVVPSLAPVDAAAFLGMLQEAAAPLLAAAAAAAQAGRSSLHQQSSGGGRRGSGLPLRSSESSDTSTNSSSCGGAGGGGGGSRSGGPQSHGGDAGSTGGVRAARGSKGACSNSDSGGGPGGDGPGLASAGGSNELSSLPLNLLLRHSLVGSKGGASVPGLFPLHPRTTTHSSCGGSAPGTPHGTPMLLVPQTVPELLSARAALMRLMISAFSFVQGPVYARMAARLAGIEDLYDSMHDDPVVMKRRKCRDMAAMRDVIKRDGSFVQAVTSVSTLRNHIYSLSRKVLIGYGHMESLPVDLLLGGLTSELASILAEPSDPQQLGQSANSSGGGHATPRDTPRASSSNSNPRASRTSNGNSSGGAVSIGGDGSSTAMDGSSGSCVLPQNVVEFFTSALPLPKLALLVFVEFVSVDPSPCGTALPLAGLGGGSDMWASSSSGGMSTPRLSSGKDRRSSSASSTDHNGAGDSGPTALSSGGGGGSGTPRDRRGSLNRYGSNRDHNRDRDSRIRDSSNGGAGSNPGTPRRGGRAASFNSAGNGNHSCGGSNGSGNSNGVNNHTGNSSTGAGSGSSGGAVEGGSSNSKRSSARRSACDFDLVAEAAALEAAATAAAPLVAAAVCDLPTGGRRQGSNPGN